MSISVFSRFLSVILLCEQGLLAQDRETSPRFVEGEVLVQFKRVLPEADLGRFARRDEVTVVRRFPRLSSRLGRSCALLRSRRRTTAELIERLGARPLIRTVEPNYLRTVSVRPQPTDPLYPEQWALNNTGQLVYGWPGAADADIDHPEAWDLADLDAPEVVVAIIDTGVDYTHPDLAANMWNNPGEIPDNEIDDDSNGYTNDFLGYDFAGDNGDPPDADPQDGDLVLGHGTHVAGIVAATRDNGMGTAGVYHRARIMALKASYDGFHLPSDATIEAIEYAILMKVEKGFNVVAINASFGSLDSYLDLERSAIEAAGDAGIIFCAGAGNDGTNTDVSPYYPAGYDLSNILAVAASGQDDELTAFSNYGATNVDLAAPGKNILSTVCLPSAPRVDVTTGPTNLSANAMGYAATTTGITARTVNALQGYPSNFPPNTAGAIALIERGTLTFREQTANAMATGAIAIVIYNNASSNFFGTLDVASNWVPVVSLSQTDGQALLTLGETTLTLVSQPYAYMEGTSMATPVVAGAVAYLAANLPMENVYERVSRILGTVDQLPAFTNKMVSGGRLNLHRAVDSDLDGLPDGWELSVTNTLTAMTDSSDSDADTVIDLWEYVSGTYALDADSYFHFNGATALTNGAVAVQWPSASYRTYELLRTTNLMVTPVSLAEGIPATTPLNVYTDDTAAAESSVFYFLRVESY